MESDHAIRGDAKSSTSHGPAVSGGLGRRLASHARNPGVVTHILIGIVVGPSVLGLIHADDPQYGPALHWAAALGIVILLFCVGLGTPLSSLKQVGRVATATATAGVVTPLVAGTLLLLALAYDWRAALFVGAAMVATSVGITARVLEDLKMENSVAARIILGAAVIDDVMGMVVLAIVGAFAAGEGASALDIGLIVAGAVAFVVLVLFFGSGVVRRLTPPPAANPTGTPRGSWKALAIAFSVCLALSAASGAVGLAPIIGAFLAGVAFADVDARYALRARLEPAKKALAPIFFGLMGVQVTLGAVLASPPLMLLALGLTALAAVTKYIPCRIAARSEGPVAARVVGAGMIPRGEVGLIVASTALAAGIMDAELFSVVVFMSIGTTLMGPPLLRLAPRPHGYRWSLKSAKVAKAAEEESAPPRQD